MTGEALLELAELFPEATRLIISASASVTQNDIDAFQRRCPHTLLARVDGSIPRAALEAALPSAPIEVEGDRARMSYGTAGEAVLIREGGLWKIEELK